MKSNKCNVAESHFDGNYCLTNISTKGQFKPKADWGARHRFSQKINERRLTYVRNYSSRQKKIAIRSFFGRILGAARPFRHYRTFKGQIISKENFCD